MADDAGEGSGPTEPTRRVASYGVCVRDGALLMVAVTDPTDARETWTLPGGGVEPLEDPVDTVVREITEETGRTGRVVRLLGVDSRVIPALEAVRGVPHQNIGIFYEVSLDGSASRSVSTDPALPRTFPIRCLVTDGARTDSPRAAARTADISSSGRASFNR